MSINKGEKLKPRSGASIDPAVVTSIVLVIEIIPLWIETSYAELSENYYNAPRKRIVRICDFTCNDE